MLTYWLYFHYPILHFDAYFHVINLIQMIILFVKKFGGKDICMNLAEGSKLLNEFSIVAQKAQNSATEAVAEAINQVNAEQK